MGQLDFQVGLIFALKPSKEPPKTIDAVLVVSSKNLHEGYREQLGKYFKVEAVEDYLAARWHLWENPFFINIIHLDLPNKHFDGLTLADNIKCTKGNSRQIYLVSEELSYLEKAEKMGFENIYTSHGRLLRGPYKSITELVPDIMRHFE